MALPDLGYLYLVTVRSLPMPSLQCQTADDSEEKLVSVKFAELHVLRCSALSNDVFLVGAQGRPASSPALASSL